MKELISIVIPVYNVEKQISKCLDSIICQTYSNIEIIIVNDGSTDNSYKLCKEYATKDSRIKLINKNNGGLSDARNCGMNNANGAYIGFVDSDDYIDKNMYNTLYNNIIKYSADISICAYKKVYNQQFDFQNNKDSSYIEVYNKENGLKQLLSDELITNHVWCKLYKRELFNNIRFPIDKNFEDIDVMYKLFDSSKKIVYTNRIQYAYYQRNNGIVKDLDKKSLIDYIDIADERYNFLINKYRILQNEIDMSQINNIYMYHKIAAMKLDKSFYDSEIMRKEYARLKSILKNKGKLSKIGLGKRMCLMVLLINRKGFYIFFRQAYKIKARMKVG